MLSHAGAIAARVDPTVAGAGHEARDQMRQQQHARSAASQQAHQQHARTQQLQARDVKHAGARPVSQGGADSATAGGP
jgi:hypothetical protein